MAALQELPGRAGHLTRAARRRLATRGLRGVGVGSRWAVVLGGGGRVCKALGQTWARTSRWQAWSPPSDSGEQWAVNLMGPYHVVNIVRLASSMVSQPPVLRVAPSSSVFSNTLKTLKATSIATARPVLAGICTGRRGAQEIFDEGMTSAGRLLKGNPPETGKMMLVFFFF